MPQARYGATVLVLSHMRAVTTALSNVLCSHPSVSGYGETHVPHDGVRAPGALVVNMIRRRAFDPRAPLIFDKLLHDRLDAAPPSAFFDARALFVLRTPGPAVASLCGLGARTGLKEGATPAAAALYYARRVERLSRLWDGFGATQRHGLASEALLADPDRQVARVGAWLGLRPMLRNRYVSPAASRQAGGGDPVTSGRHTRIRALPPAPRPNALPDGVPVDLAARCVAAHAALAARLAARAPVAEEADW